MTYIFGHLVNHIVSLFQSTSGLCFTNQLYPKNMSILFKSMTAVSIYFLYLLIFTSSGTNCITSPFFILSVLKTSNDLSIGSILILSFLTSCLSILVWVYLVSRSKKMDLIYFIFYLFFYFLFLEQLGLGLIGHAITSVTWWRSHKTDHKTWENLVEDSRIDDIIQHGYHMLASWTTHSYLG